MNSRLLVLALGCLVMLMGCTPDRTFKPGTDYPEWAFDKPAYYKPPEEPVPFMMATDGGPDIYYTGQRMVFIKRPAYPDAREAPRPSVFTTKDNGQTWEKMGNFGLAEPYFGLLLPGEDGTYGVCVIGVHRPELTSANLRIQQVYILDSQGPTVEITVNPEEGPYWAGQSIELTWTISDPHLGTKPARLYSRIVDPDIPTVWRKQKSELGSTGTITITADQLSASAKGLQFRIEATDQMGNVGVGYTPLLRLMDSAPTTAQSATSGVFIAATPGHRQSESLVKEPLPELAPTTVILPGPGAKTVTISPTATPKVTSENMPPWSWNEQTVAVSPTPTAIPPPEIKPEPESKSEITSTSKAKQSEPDTEMAELEQLLAGVSSPVYRGRVQKAPQPEPVAQAAPVIAAATSPAEVPSQKITADTTAPVEPTRPKPIATPPEPVVLEPEPEEPAQVTSTSGEVIIRPIMPAEPIVTVKPPAESAAEPVVLVPPTPEPVVRIPAPSKASEPVLDTATVPAEAKTTVVLAEPKAPALLEPATGSGPIVTATPATPPALESKPSEPVPSAAIPKVSTTTLSHGQNRMAKPWERLGNPTAAANSFYTHAPTLSNY